MAESPDLNPIEHAFRLPDTKLKAGRPTDKQQLKAAAVKDWQSTSRKETPHLVKSMGSRLQSVVDCKGFTVNNCWLTHCEKGNFYFFFSQAKPIYSLGLSLTHFHSLCTSLSLFISYLWCLLARSLALSLWPGTALSFHATSHCNSAPLPSSHSPLFSPFLFPCFPLCHHRAT